MQRFFFKNRYHRSFVAVLTKIDILIDYQNNNFANRQICNYTLTQTPNPKTQTPNPKTSVVLLQPLQPRSIPVDRHPLLAHIHAAEHNHQYITAQHRRKQPPLEPAIASSVRRKPIPLFALYFSVLDAATTSKCPQQPKGYECGYYVMKWMYNITFYYSTDTLGRPLVELAQKLSKEESCVGQVSFTENTGARKEKKIVDWTKIHQMKKEKIPSWTMKLLVDVLTNSGLSTMSDMLNEGGVELNDHDITSEEVAIATAVRIFNNVIKDKNKNESQVEFHELVRRSYAYIERGDVLRFMIWEEVNLVQPFFEVNEDGHIDIKTFSQWV
ncbi:hypothetical protein KSS87_019556, partial [Heliosperma pusillum]